MAPERKSHSSKKSRKSAQRHQANDNTSSGNAANGNSDNVNASAAAAAGTTNSFSEPHPPTHTNDSQFQFQNTSTNPQHHPIEQVAYTYIDRPWQPNIDPPQDSRAIEGASPMERWQAESTSDQPWYGMEGMYAYGNQSEVAYQGGNGKYEWDMEGNTRDVDSLAHVGAQFYGEGGVADFQGPLEI